MVDGWIVLHGWTLHLFIFFPVVAVNLPGALQSLVMLLFSKYGWIVSFILVNIDAFFFSLYFLCETPLAALVWDHFFCCPNSQSSSAGKLFCVNPVHRPRMMSCMIAKTKFCSVFPINFVYKQKAEQSPSNFNWQMLKGDIDDFKLLK